MNSDVCSGDEFHWWHHGPSRTLVVSVAFGLGPRIAAENLMSDLGLAPLNGIQWSRADQGYLPLMGDVDRFFNFGVSKQLVDYRPELSIWIDCVDWLRTELPQHIQHYDLLLREAFFRSEVRDGKGDLKKWRDVAPLIKPKKRSAMARQNLVVLSFGGVATPYSTNVQTTEMPLAFLRGLACSIDRLSDRRIVAFVPDNLLAKARQVQIISERINLQQLDRESFAQAMSECCLLVCQPGLYTPFEAMQIGLPFVLTYPMSFTQAVQLERLKSLGAVCHPPVLSTSACVAPLQDIETIEAQWFSSTTAEWSDLAAAKATDITEAFMADVLDDRRSFNSYTVSYPSTPTITAASVIQNEYTIEQ